jgi:hypothetical protein
VSIDNTNFTLSDLTFDVGSVSTTEFGYLNGVTSAIQTQLDARALESVVGTSLNADDLELDGAVLQTAAEIPHIDAAQNWSADQEFQDGIPVSFGNDNDVEIAYDETTDDRLEMSANRATDIEFYMANAGDGDFDLRVGGTIYAAAFETTAASGDSYLLLYNNADISPIASAYQLYYEGGNLVSVENGTEKEVLNAADSFTLTGTSWDFSGGTNFELPSAAADAAGEISISTGNQLKWHDGAKVVTIDTTTTTDNYVLKYDNATATFNLEEDATGGSPTMDSVGDATADATITFDAGEEMSWQYTGAFTTGSQFLVQQQTGNPTGGTLFQVSAADTDVTPFNITHNGEDITVAYSASNTMAIGTTTGVSLIDTGGIGIGVGNLDVSDANITNVGNIALDSITADGTNVLFGTGAATQLQFRDTAIYIASLDDGHLDLEADTSVDINAPLVVGGNMTIPDAGNIGSASDTDAIAIAANGEVTFSQEVQAGAGIDVSGGTLTAGTIAGTVTDGTASWNASTQALTGFATFETDAAEVNGTITLANDETIANSTDTQILFSADSGENLALDLDTATDNEIAISSPGGATDINFGSLNMATTGTILGATNVIVTTDGTESPTAAQMYGTFFVADHATATSDTDYTLPTAAAGMVACFYDNGGGAGGIIIDAAAGDEILLDGTGIGAAEAIDSPGVAGDGANGDFICIMAIDDTNWITLGRSGTWVDGGAD